MSRIRWLAAVLACVLLMCVMSGCEGEPPGDDNKFPDLAASYTVEDFENIRFRCTVSWETDAGVTREKEFSKSDSVELYNLLDRGAWRPAEENPTAATQPILTLEFSTGDTVKPKNCYGCMYLSDADQVVFTPSSGNGGLAPYVVPAGTYEAVWDKVSQAFGE